MSEAELDRNELNQLESMAGELESDSVIGGDSVTVGNDNGELKQALTVCLLGGFSILAPNWEVSQDECTALAECYSTVIDKYFPDAAGSFGVEVSALLMTAGVIGSRMMQGKPRKEKTVDELKHVGADDESKNNEKG